MIKNNYLNIASMGYEQTSVIGSFNRMLLLTKFISNIGDGFFTMGCFSNISNYDMKNIHDNKNIINTVSRVGSNGYLSVVGKIGFSKNN